MRVNKEITRAIEKKYGLSGKRVVRRLEEKGVKLSERISQYLLHPKGMDRNEFVKQRKNASLY